jgi:hypothetical protein
MSKMPTIVQMSPERGIASLSCSGGPVTPVWPRPNSQQGFSIQSTNRFTWWGPSQNRLERDAAGSPITPAHA